MVLVTVMEVTDDCDNNGVGTSDDDFYDVPYPMPSSVTGTAPAKYLPYAQPSKAGTILFYQSGELSTYWVLNLIPEGRPPDV